MQRLRDSASHPHASRRKRPTAVLLALACVPTRGPQDAAARATDPESGRTYVRSAELLTFYDAEALARAMGGALASIVSSAEETFLLDNFGAAEAYWIGLEFPHERWATGESVDYRHWFVGQPDGERSEPFTLLNLGEPGAWADSTGDVASERFRALIEFPPGVEPGASQVVPETRSASRGVLLCAIQGLGQRDLENPRNPHLNRLWKRSAWTADAAADGSGDPLAGLGMLVWGVGSAQSALDSSSPQNAARGRNENLLSRLERSHPDVSTACLFDDPVLAGILMDGRVDLRASNASPRRGGNPAAIADAFGRAVPACILVAWTDLEAAQRKPPTESERAKALSTIDAELGVVLAALEARASHAAEEWWIAVAGLAPVPDKKLGRPEDLRARTAVPLVLVAAGLAPGEIRAEVGLVDLVPSALAHLGIEQRRSSGLDGRVLTLERPAAFGENLIQNGDAEAQFGWNEAPFPVVTGWRQLGGFRVGRHEREERGAPARGESCFRGLAPAPQRLEQDLDLAALLPDIARGDVRFRLSGWLRAPPGAQTSIECALEFLNEQEKPLERFVLGPVGSSARDEEGGASPAAEGWVEKLTTGKVPRRARVARLALTAAGPRDVSGALADELRLVLERE